MAPVHFRAPDQEETLSLWKIGSISFTEQHFLPVVPRVDLYFRQDKWADVIIKAISSGTKPEKSGFHVKSLGSR